MRCLFLPSVALALAVGGLWSADPARVAAQAGSKESASFAGTKAGQEWSDNGLKMKFCWCPAGKFTMGSPKEEKDRFPNEDQVSVTISRGFWLAKCEVTQSEWERIMKTSIRDQAEKGTFAKTLAGEGPTYPMYFVNHDGVTEFCRKLTDQERKAGRLPAEWEYRLPTEAQWEYACRAETKTATAFGDRLGTDQANFNALYPYNGAAKGKDLNRTATVGSYEANAWGLHDMHGNVWEWCRDWYDKAIPGGTDPEVTEKASYRVLRGGSWYDYGRICRSASRSGDDPAYRYQRLGFRVAAVQN